MVRRQKIRAKFREWTEEVILEFEDRKIIQVSQLHNGHILLRTLDHKFILHPTGAVNTLEIQMRGFSE